jgi:hypothetical protein
MTQRRPCVSPRPAAVPSETAIRECYRVVDALEAWGSIEPSTAR